MGVEAAAEPGLGALRQAVLAVTVLDDLDLEPRAGGVAVPTSGGSLVVVGWDRVGAALRADPPHSPIARLRVATLLRTAAALADDSSASQLRGHVRALALPPDHALHPGPAWVRERVLGGALHLGIGLLDPPWRPDGDGGRFHAVVGSRLGGGWPVPLPPGAVGAGAGVDAWWPQVRAHAVRMGGLAAARVRRDAPGLLGPVGGCDVLTLLATRPLRAALAAGDGSGMRAVAVPSRQRGWYDLRRVDPAFVAAVWTATEEGCRGVPGALLVTRDEVALPGGSAGRPGQDPT